MLRYKFLLTLLAILAVAGSASATTIWGRITGLGSFGSSNYIQNIKIITERNEIFYGRARVVQGPGLIWEADVPSVQGWGWFNRSYRVEVRVSGIAAESVVWNPETAWGYWMGWMPSKQCNDIKFVRR